jgi:hypothetical protein
MSNDLKGLRKLEALRVFYDEAQELAEPYRRAYVAALLETTDTPPSLRYVNLATIDAIKKFLIMEEPEGASPEQIRDGLIAGGFTWNKPYWERDLKNSLSTGVRHGLLLKEGNKYFPGDKKPSHRVNRHKRVE